MEADEASNPYTKSCIELNSLAMVEYDNPKRLLIQSILPYTCYYTTMVFIHAVHLNISCVVENMATEVAIQASRSTVVTS